MLKKWSIILLIYPRRKLSDQVSYKCNRIFVVKQQDELYKDLIRSFVFISQSESKGTEHSWSREGRYRLVFSVFEALTRV
jgi:hypothetical protein